MAVKYRQNPLLYASFCLLYLLPLTLFGLYSFRGLGWPLFFGLLIGGVGIAIFTLLLRLSDLGELRAPSLAPFSPFVEDRRREVEEECERLKGRCSELEQELVERGQELYRLSGELEEAHREKEAIYAEYQQALSKQRARLDSKQERVAQLENKVRDLSFEIRTLLQVDEMEGREPPSVETGPAQREVDQWVETLPLSSDQGVRSQYDALILLRRCLQVAQGLTGAGHFSGGAGRFRELSLTNATIDLRRLFDRLRSETGGVVIAFSRAENRLLFANPATRTLFGWSSERFTKDFSLLIQGGRSEWETAVQTLQPQEEVAVRLVIRDKAGRDLLVQCCMAMVDRGPFRGSILAVLYRTDLSSSAVRSER